MSRGLGKTQRAILQHLEENGGIMALATLAFDLWWNDRENFKDNETAFVSASRACTALEKRGLITKKRRFYDGQDEVTECSAFIPNTEITLVKR